MELSELRLVSASNIINLRTRAGMTQSELGARLNYSDKTISKWERGEAIPDAFVLTQLGELFGVSVDYILSSHDGWEAPAQPEEQGPSYSAEAVTALAVLSVWTAALAAFVALWVFGIIWWRIFAIALPVSLLVYLILLAVFKRTRYMQHAIAAFVVSVFIFVFLMFPEKLMWQLFLLVPPALGIVYLSCNIRTKPGKHRARKAK